MLVRNRRSHRHRSWWLTGLLAALALVAAACSPAEPEDELAGAFERTLGSSFTYEVSLEGEQQEGTDELGMALRGLTASGVRDGSSWSARVRILGFDVFELHSEDPELRHLRLGLADVLSLVGGPDADPSAAIVQEMAARGHDEQTIAIAQEAMRGGWISIEGPLDARDLDRAIGVEDGAGERPDTSAILEALGGDLQTFVDEYVEVVGVDEAGDTEVFDVELRVREAVRSLSQLDPEAPDELELDELPDRLPGTVTVSDGLVREILVTFSDPEGDDGRTMIRVDLADHGDAPSVSGPEDAMRVSAERFLVALEAATEILGDAGPLPFP